MAIIQAQPGPRDGEADERPYVHSRSLLREPDWRRLPGWRDVSEAQWRDAQWQRAHCVKNLKELRDVVGDLLADSVFDDLEADRTQYATMSMLLTPHILNTMVPYGGDGVRSYTDLFVVDPVRRYMLPMASDRDPDWPTHPYAERDSLHEQEMWVVEGLTHRYHTKVLAELVSTCPQYCGHCTRMDLVGNSTPQVQKVKLTLKPVDRQERMLQYLRTTPHVRDIVVSGGDVANVPWPRLESFLLQLLEIETIRDIRLASKALAGLPQHWLQPRLLEGLAKVSRIAAGRQVNLALHTHVNHVQSVTPLVAEAARAVLDAGLRDVRNQGVLMRGVNDTPAALLDLCMALQGEANILPYYFYLCDMIPNAEHWRISVTEAQRLQESIMGYLPGYATPRLVCDVPYLGKRWVHQLTAYDTERGISSWGPEQRTHNYYDPISTLPASGRAWWADHALQDAGSAHPPEDPCITLV